MAAQPEQSPGASRRSVAITRRRGTSPRRIARASCWVRSRAIAQKNWFIPCRRREPSARSVEQGRSTHAHRPARCPDRRGPSRSHTPAARVTTLLPRGSLDTVSGESLVVPPSARKYNVHMADADAWAVLLVIDREDKHVLCEATVELRKEEKQLPGKPALAYVLANPPVELTVVQEGVPRFLVLQDLRGNEQQRTRYVPGPGKRIMRVHPGDAIRLDALTVYVSRK